MAELGATSLGRLEGVKPATLARANALARLATQHGFDIGIAEYGGLRDLATQQQLLKWEQDSVAAGGKPYAVATPGKSKHETGDAFDIFIDVLPSTFPDKEAGYKFLADLAPSLGLRAGYYFSRKDEFHFENVDGSSAGLDTGLMDDTGDVTDDEGTVIVPSGFTTVGVIAALVIAGVILFGSK